MTTQSETPDVLTDRMETAWSDLVQHTRIWLSTQADARGNTPPEPPDLERDLDCASCVHAITDKAVPTREAEIASVWNAHASKLEAAHRKAGRSGDPRKDKDGKEAIYCYIRQELADRYSRLAKTITKEWWNEKRASRS